MAEDPIIQRIESFRCRRRQLFAERRNRGYTLYRASSGALVARLRPIGQDDRLEVLSWSLWKERAATVPELFERFAALTQGIRIGSVRFARLVFESAGPEEYHLVASTTRAAAPRFGIEAEAKIVAIPSADHHAP
jgi:hypothetical protein